MKKAEVNYDKTMKSFQTLIDHMKDAMGEDQRQIDLWMNSKEDHRRAIVSLEQDRDRFSKAHFNPLKKEATP